MRVVTCIFVSSVSRIYISMLLRLFNWLGHKISVGELVIYGMKKTALDEFGGAVGEALKILDGSFPKYREIVSKSLCSIVLQTRKGTGLTTYVHPCCFVRWNAIRAFGQQMQSQILATLIVHEAYRATCYGQVGFKAYRDQDIENECVLRDIRMLKVFAENASEPYRQEFYRIINSLQSAVC